MLGLGIISAKNMPDATHLIEVLNCFFYHTITQIFPRFYQKLHENENSSNNFQTEPPPLLGVVIQHVLYNPKWVGSKHSFADGLKETHVFQMSCGLVNTFQ